MHSCNYASCWLIHLIKFICHTDSSKSIQVMMIETCNIFVLGGYPATAVKERTTTLFMYILRKYIEYPSCLYIQNVYSYALG